MHNRRQHHIVLLTGVPRRLRICADPSSTHGLAFPTVSGRREAWITMKSGCIAVNRDTKLHVFRWGGISAANQLLHGSEDYRRALCMYCEQESPNPLYAGPHRATPGVWGNQDGGSLQPPCLGIECRCRSSECTNIGSPGVVERNLVSNCARHTQESHARVYTRPFTPSHCIQTATVQHDEHHGMLLGRALCCQQGVGAQMRMHLGPHWWG
jgi:hypothetical protein